jgi:hypothetical protein
MTLAVRLIAFSRAGPGGPSVPPGVGVARDHEHRRWVLSNHPHHRFGQRLQLRNLIGRDLPRSGCEVDGVDLHATHAGAQFDIVADFVEGIGALERHQGWRCESLVQQRRRGAIDIDDRGQMFRNVRCAISARPMSHMGQKRKPSKRAQRVRFSHESRHESGHRFMSAQGQERTQALQRQHCYFSPRRLSNKLCWLTKKEESKGRRLSSSWMSFRK